MASKSKDKDREARIENEIVVDAYDASERAMGWYYYLEEKLQFPFTATCIKARPISPLRVGDEVEVNGMAPEEECEHEMFVMIRWERPGLAIPLALLKAVAADEATTQAVEDYVPRRDRDEWHRKAMAAAKGAELADFMDLCMETREIDLLAGRVDAAAAPNLKSISHYVTEKAATALARQHGVSAAKLSCAMAMRILDAGKSKYYDAALEHLRTARDLYSKHGQEPAWQLVVARVRENHRRKLGFMASFEEIVAGGSRPATQSFEARARSRWRKQTSG